jgi:hypothetical protein
MKPTLTRKQIIESLRFAEATPSGGLEVTAVTPIGTFSVSAVPTREGKLDVSVNFLGVDRGIKGPRVDQVIIDEINVESLGLVHPR